MRPDASSAWPISRGRRRHGACSTNGRVVGVRDPAVDAEVGHGVDETVVGEELGVVGQLGGDHVEGGLGGVRRDLHPVHDHPAGVGLRVVESLLEVGRRPRG